MFNVSVDDLEVKKTGRKKCTDYKNISELILYKNLLIFHADKIIQV